MRSAPIPCSLRRLVGWARRFRGAWSPCGALQQIGSIHGSTRGPGWRAAERAPVREGGPPGGGYWRPGDNAGGARGACARPRGTAGRVWRLGRRAGPYAWMRLCLRAAVGRVCLRHARAPACPCPACSWLRACASCVWACMSRARAVCVRAGTSCATGCERAPDAGIARCTARMLQEPWPWFS